MNYASKKISRFDVFYRSGTADEHVLEQSFSHDIFYKCVPELKLKSDAVILDIGAHIGTFSLVSAMKVPQGKVYAIEAGEDSYKVLDKNVTTNTLKNVTTLHCALSDKDGEVTLHQSEKVGNWGFSITKALGGAEERVESISLRSLFEKYNIEAVDFLKSNCEGAEFSIFLSTPDDTLKKIKLALILYHSDLEDRFTLDALMNKFKSNGFTAEIFNKTARRGWLLVKNKDVYSSHKLTDIISNKYIGPISRSKYIFKMRKKAAM